MEPRHRRTLRRHRALLCEELLLDEAALLLLYQEDVLTHSQVEDLQLETRNRTRTCKLLNLLPHRGPRAFPAFIQAIQPNCPWIADRLLLSAQEEGQGQDPGLEVTSDRFSVPENVLQRVPTDQQLNRLAALLGSDWESVLLDLGLTQVEIDRCRADHAHSSLNQVVAALVRWRQSRGRRATVQLLLHSLQICELHPSALHQVFV